jgi:hypothetical protein
MTIYKLLTGLNDANAAYYLLDSDEQRGDIS